MPGLLKSATEIIYLTHPIIHYQDRLSGVDSCSTPTYVDPNKGAEFLRVHLHECLQTVDRHYVPPIGTKIFNVTEPSAAGGNGGNNSRPSSVRLSRPVSANTAI